MWKYFILIIGFGASFFSIVAPSGGCEHSKTRAPCSHCLMPNPVVKIVKNESEEEEDEKDEKN